MDGRPHNAPALRSWMGDSRGRWEGDTLVIDTTNFTDRTNFRGAGANLHLSLVFFAVPTQDHYTPTIAVTIDPDTGAMFAEDAGRHLHAGNNRGAMLAIGYWCENGCEGRLELRNHKGHLFASLHNESPTPADDRLRLAGQAEELSAI